MELLALGGWGRRLTLLVGVTTAGCKNDGVDSSAPEGCQDPPTSIAADDPIEPGRLLHEGTAGLVPSDQARLVSGTYESTFEWSDEPVEDFTFRVSYEGGPARNNCGIPQIEVVTAMHSSRSNIAEEGRSWLSIAPMPSADPFDSAFNHLGWMGNVDVHGRRFSAGTWFHWMPSGIRARGTLVENGVNRAGSFPADACEERFGLDDDFTAPTLRTLLEQALEALSQNSESWQQGEPGDRGRFAPPTVDVVASNETACNVFGEAIVELAGTVAFEDGTSLATSGTLRAIHGLEDPRVKWIELALHVAGPLDQQSIYPDGPSCNVQIPSVYLYAERSSDDEELVLPGPEFRGYCP